MIASLTHDQLHIWEDSSYAQALLNKINPGFIERTMLLRPDGSLLASTDFADENRINQYLSINGLGEALAGKEIVHTFCSPSLQGEVVDVLSPVIGDDEQILGIVRLTYHYDTVYEDVIYLRYLILTIVLAGLLSNATAGSTLALRVSQPIREVTHLNGAYRDPVLMKELLEGMDDNFKRLGCTLDDMDQLAENLPKVFMDPVRMAQSVGNLISNAVKYTPSGGRVVISQGVDPGGFWIKVQDTGPGIAIEEQEKIFMPYYRVEGTRKNIPGMGLGLSIASDFIAAHGGKISLESRPGEGSTFKIRIPLQVPD